MGESVKKIFHRFKNQLFCLKTAQLITEIAFLVITSFLFYVNMNFWYKILIFILLFVFYYIMQQIFSETKKKSFPNIKNRYTYKTESGGVYINPQDYHQAILRLSEFEDFIQV